MTDPDNALDDTLDDDALEAAAGGYGVSIQIVCPVCDTPNCGKH